MEILELDDVELAIDRRGPDNAPVLLLIGGGGQSMDWWTPELCDRLGGGDLQVIRYDHRDTGQSSTAPPDARTTPATTSPPTHCGSSTHSASRART